MTKDDGRVTIVADPDAPNTGTYQASNYYGQQLRNQLVAYVVVALLGSGFTAVVDDDYHDGGHNDGSNSKNCLYSVHVRKLSPLAR